MIPEIGHLALILALALALVQGVLPIIGAARGNAALMALARPAARGQRRCDGGGDRGRPPARRTS